MESWLNFICDYAHHAPWIIFCLLMLAGLNLPISEDIMLLTGGMLASSCLQEEKMRLFLWIYAGCWMSAWIAYWMGRLLGPKLYHIRYFNSVVTPQRIHRLHTYYEKFGILTFIVGRFIPGGARNALFMTAGLGKMPFLVFIIRDGIACLISSSVIFLIGYKFAQNYELIVKNFRHFGNILAFILVIGLIVVAIWSYKKHNQ